MKQKVAVLPIWRIVFSDKLYYYILGTSKKRAIENIKNNSDVIFDGKTLTIEQVSFEDADHILLQLDYEDDDFTTLHEEAIYYSEHHLECDFFLASSFDVIADSKLDYSTQN